MEPIVRTAKRAHPVDVHDFHVLVDRCLERSRPEVFVFVDVERQVLFVQEEHVLRRTMRVSNNGYTVEK